MLTLKLRVSEHPSASDVVRDMVRLSGVIAGKHPGVIAGKHRRALDPAVFDGAVQRQDTMTMVTSQRRVRMLVPELTGSSSTRRTTPVTDHLLPTRPSRHRAAQRT